MADITPQGFPVNLFGHYYYRENNFMPVRITIVAKGEKPGFYKCVKGHWTESEAQNLLSEAFLIHINRITV